jgi:hypothetical protein
MEHQLGEIVTLLRAQLHTQGHAPANSHTAAAEHPTPAAERQPADRPTDRPSGGGTLEDHRKAANIERALRAQADRERRQAEQRLAELQTRFSQLEVSMNEIVRNTCMLSTRDLLQPAAAKAPAAAKDTKKPDTKQKK